MIKLIDIIREMKVHDPYTIIKLEDMQAIPDTILNWLRDDVGDNLVPIVDRQGIISFNDAYDDYVDWCEQGDEAEESSINFKQILKSYINKIIEIDMEHLDPEYNKYLVVKPEGIIYINKDNTYEDAAKSGLSIEDQMKDTAFSLLGGRSKKVVKGEIDLADTDFTLYKYILKGVFKFPNNNTLHDINLEYYFIYPDDQEINMQQFYERNALPHESSDSDSEKFSISALMSNNSSPVFYDEQQLKDMILRRDVKKLQAYKDISIPTSIYNLLLSRANKAKKTSVHLDTKYLLVGTPLVYRYGKSSDREAIELHNITT